MRYPKLHADKLKIVIFDWDNTLAETRTPLIYAVNRVLKEYGLPEWKEVRSCATTTCLSVTIFPVFSAVGQMRPIGNMPKSIFAASPDSFQPLPARMRFCPG